MAELHDIHADNSLRAGDRLDITGLLVDQCYGVWHVWVYRAEGVAESAET